jgi:hypothetical protein
MQALLYPHEGDTCNVVTSTGVTPWQAVATGKIAHSSVCLVGQNGMDWVHVSPGGGSLFKATSLGAMQAITTAQVGDLCTVSLSGSDAIWQAVTQGKYPHGANCLAGVSVDWFFPVDRISGFVTLINGHGSVYLPGVDPDSVPKIWYMSFAGDIGTLSAHMITNGVSLDSTSSTDGSTVGYEVQFP